MGDEANKSKITFPFGVKEEADTEDLKPKALMDSVKKLRFVSHKNVGAEQACK